MSRRLGDETGGGAPGASGATPPFFSDPAMDRFAAAFLNLASELWVQSERLANLSDLLAEKGLVVEAELSAIASRPDTEAKREAELRQYLDRVLQRLREGA